MKKNNIKNIGAKIKSTIIGCDLASLSDIAPIRIAVPIVVATRKNPLGSCFGISNFIPSLFKNLPSIKVILEKCLTTNGTPSRVVQNIIELYIGQGAGAFGAVMKTKPIPIINPTANIRFQKLSLFLRESMKLFLRCFGLSYIPPNSLGTVVTTVVVDSSCLNGFVKSSISIISNCWFKTYNFIIPKYPNVLKRIMYLWLALSLCFPWNGAYATEAELSSTNELTEYIKLVEKDNSIPRGLLLAIAKTESNINPYAINVNGKAVFANSMQEAVLVAKRALARGIIPIAIINAVY